MGKPKSAKALAAILAEAAEAEKSEAAHKAEQRAAALASEVESMMQEEGSAYVKGPNSDGSAGGKKKKVSRNKDNRRKMKLDRQSQVKIGSGRGV